MGKTTINPYATGLRWNRTRVNYTAKRNSYERRVSACHGLQFIFYVAGLSGKVSHLFLLDRFSPDPEGPKFYRLHGQQVVVTSRVGFGGDSAPNPSV